MPSRRETVQLRVDYANVIAGLKEADTATRREVRASSATPATKSGRAPPNASTPTTNGRRRATGSGSGNAASRSNSRFAAQPGSTHSSAPCRCAKALVPSLDANEDSIYEDFEKALDKSALIFNGGL